MTVPVYDLAIAFLIVAPMLVEPVVSLEAAPQLQG
jgi:hypothetical protein